MGWNPNPDSRHMFWQHAITAACQHWANTLVPFEGVEEDTLDRGTTAPKLSASESAKPPCDSRSVSSAAFGNEAAICFVLPASCKDNLPP